MQIILSRSHQPPNVQQQINQGPPTSIAALGDAAAAMRLGYPNHQNPYINAPPATHQDYLNRLHASALANAADQALEGKSKVLGCVLRLRRNTH